MLLAFKDTFTLPPEWIYRGEGNCNVVISLPKQHQILRMRKVGKSKSIFTWFIKLIANILSWYYGNPTSDENRDLAFYRQVFRKLLGAGYVCDAKQVFLSKKQTSLIANKINNKRPDSRRHKKIQYGRAALFQDYAYFPDKLLYSSLDKPTFAVEIKPKQGWMPFSERHFPKCVFCMNQFLKLKRGQIKSISHYCPLDLFSGDSVRVRNAIKNLIRNPQNNFKIFTNGSQCYGAGSEFDVFEDFLAGFFNKCTDDNKDSLTDEFCCLVEKCLLADFGGSSNNNCDKKLFCQWNRLIHENSVQNKLPIGSILERILSVQMLDVEGNQYYSKLLGNKTINDYNYVRSLLKQVSKNQTTCLKCQIMMLEDTDLVFAPYLISAVAKDCSLMITLKRVLEGNRVHEDLTVFETKFGSYAANVGVFDLYPKPLSTILKHKKKYLEMAEVYEDVVNCA